MKPENVEKSEGTMDGPVSDSHKKDLLERVEWFLIRVDVAVNGQVLRAGTPIRRQGQRWILNGATEPLPIAMDDKVCKAEYIGLPLHLVFRELDGRLFHRKVGGNVSLQEIAPDKVVAPPMPGTSSVCVLYGDQLWPPESLFHPEPRLTPISD